MKKQFKQGIYCPINREKYLGKDNPRYLSSWELKLFSFCDNSNNIIKWCSEKVIIPYFDSIAKKNRNYYVDMLFSMKTENNKIINYLVEIKPYRETQPPKNSKRKKPSTLLYEQLTYQKNQDKWKAAKIFAEKNNLKFVIITENELSNFK